MNSTLYDNLKDDISNYLVGFGNRDWSVLVDSPYRIRAIFNSPLSGHELHAEMKAFALKHSPDWQEKEMVLHKRKLLTLEKQPWVRSCFVENKMTREYYIFIPLSAIPNLVK